jgi:hypothetical protein
VSEPAADDENTAERNSDSSSSNSNNAKRRPTDQPAEHTNERRPIPASHPLAGLVE